MIGPYSRSTSGVAILALALMVFSVRNIGRRSVEDPESGFRVAVAASLTDVALDAVTRWNDTEEESASAVFASSSTLARQLESGAPFDVVLLADERWMDRLVMSGCVDADSLVALASGRLVIARPKESGPLARGPAEIDGAALPAGRWTTGDPAHVPLGRYAASALRKSGAWESIADDLVPTADARAALRLVERGEVEWGILYRTDVEASDVARIERELDPALHDPITYWGATVTGAPPAAQAFLDRLVDRTGASLFEMRGFEPPPAAEEGQ